MVNVCAFLAIGEKTMIEVKSVTCDLNENRVGAIKSCAEEGWDLVYWDEYRLVFKKARAVDGDVKELQQKVSALRDALASARRLAQELLLVAESTELLDIARRAIEDALLELRNSRISVVRNNGLVIREIDGTPSNVIRMGPEIAMRIGLKAIADYLEQTK